MFVSRIFKNAVFFQIAPGFAFFVAAVVSTTRPVCAEEDPVRLRSGLQWFSALEWQNLEDSSLNPLPSDHAHHDDPRHPYNPLALKDRALINDLRPQFKLSTGSLTLVARPQWRHEVSSHKIDSEKRSRESSSFVSRWLDAYVTLDATSHIQWTYGIHTYQWGAAESLNPSNKIFNDSADSRSLLTATPGRPMARVNVTWTPQVSSVFMAETDQQERNSRSEYRYSPTKDPASSGEEDDDSQKFDSKILMKHEVSWNQGADYFGVVFGTSQEEASWWGEYFNQSLIEGLSLYGDAAHEKGSRAWYPVMQSSPVFTDGVVTLNQSKVNDSKTYTLATLGLRYSFEGGSDVRCEGVYNNAGWSQEESRLGLRAIDRQFPSQASLFVENAAKWAKPGLAYRSQGIGLLSARSPDFFDVKDLVWYGRYLRSLQDSSSQTYSSLEWSFETITWIAGALHTSGKKDSEFKSMVHQSFLVGLKQTY